MPASAFQVSWVSLLLERGDAMRAKHANLLAGLALVTLVMTAVGSAVWLLFGPSAVALAVAGLLLALIAAARFPPDAQLRLYRALLIKPDESQISGLIDVLAFRAGLQRRPALYVIPSLAVSAFSVGTARASAIAVTEGLLRQLSLRETAGLLAHEIAHLRTGDAGVLGLADSLTRISVFLSYVALGLAAYNGVAAVTHDRPLAWGGILCLYLLPSGLSFVQLSLSRDRDFAADAEAVRLTGDPAALIAALSQIETGTGHWSEDLCYPVPARRVPVPSLLRVDPPAAARIARIEALGPGPAPDALVIAEQPMTSLVGYGPGEMRPRYRWPGLWF